MGRPYTCRICEQSKTHDGPGNLPKTCPQCKERPEIARHEQKRRSTTNRNKTAAITEHIVSKDGLKAARVAVGLSISSDPVEACRYVGLDLSESEAQRLCDISRASWPDIISGKPTATARMVDRACMLLAIKALEEHHLLSPRDIPGALRNLAHYNELSTGEAKAQYSQIIINIPTPVPDRSPPAGMEPPKVPDPKVA